MLEITIPSVELYDESSQTFTESKEQVLQLEHSLVSVSKWESKWKKAFLTKENKTFEETVDYIRCMTITQNVNPDVYKYVTASNIREVSAYIEDTMTATTFTEDETKKFNHKIITAEVIYYWMVSFNIPVEFQKWHLNRLLTLIRVCNVMNQPSKKIGRSKMLKNQRELNAARKQALNTTG